VGPRAEGLLARHLRGWPLVPISVGIALLATILVVPRPSEPDAIPLPRVDRSEERRVTIEEAARADQAQRSRLPFDVRAVGELLRRYGASRDDPGASSELASLRSATHRALQSSRSEPLLRLRAIQTRLFVEALGSWSQSGVASRDLEELGGDFIERATQNGWVTANRRIVPTRDEQALLFRLRWTALTGLQEQMPFRPSLNDWRAYYRFLIENPERSAIPANAHSGTSAGDSYRRLGYIDALARRDTEYPLDLARGALLVRLGEHLAAVEALRRHLEVHPEGPWSLRARNYLAAALERAAPAPED
jgi:hypothetical protein